MFTREQAVWQCPKCDGHLPYNLDKGDNIIVGLVGGGNTGKSHYIAVLIDQLVRQAGLAGLGCIGSPLGDTRDRYNNGYYQPLIVRREVIPVTRPLLPGQQNRPLVYVLSFIARGGSRTRKLANLVLFDASGEQTEDEMDRLVFQRYIHYSSGLIFLADPGVMPGVIDFLPLVLQHTASSTPSQRRSYEVLSSVVEDYRREHNVSDKSPIRIPVAITVSKSDLLSYVPDAAGVVEHLSRDVGYEHGVRMASVRSLGQEIRELVRRVEDPAFAHWSDTLATAEYFGVSATGGPPDATGHFPSLQPSRCLDPLAWILWKLGLVAGEAG